jgi:uncharacterized protein involved in type VI secretion and phage assembly
MKETVDARGVPPGKLWGTYLAEVVSVKDTQKLGRVQVRLLGFDGVGAQDAPMWARVAVPFSGADRGAFFIPNKGDEVVVQFVGGDPRLPLVTGGLWNGSAKPPEQLGGSGEEVDRWTIVGKQGTRVAIVEEQAGATISLTTPQKQQSVEVTAKNSGKVELKTATATITLDSQGVTIQTTGKVKVQASTVDVNAAMLTVNAAVSKFNGLVKAPIVQATTVLGTIYSPGVGNVW